MGANSQKVQRIFTLPAATSRCEGVGVSYNMVECCDALRDRQLHALNSSLACATSALNSVDLENTARIPADAACGSTSRLL